MFFRVCTEISRTLWVIPFRMLRLDTLFIMRLGLGKEFFSETRLIEKRRMARFFVKIFKLNDKIRKVRAP